MPLQIGQQLGSYEITSLLGKGGMGEVYRARDPKLKRDVAIKILPDEFSLDADRVSRFQREAEALAALNHHNIAGIYDLQQSATTRFLILEFVEGDTLADIVRERGALPVDEALQIAKQICEALEAAHEKGIVHRDLKPANVKVTPEGKVKVLDFGLAKALDPSPGASRHPLPGGEGFSNSPTMLSGTMGGAILGTAAYMSPEQARGKTVDRRTDVWAFGCVLYEMLAGKPAFAGESVTDILARVLEREPNLDFLPDKVPAKVRGICRRCLEKDVRRRFQDIGDVRYEIEGVLAGAPESTLRAQTARAGRFARLHSILTALLAMIVLVLAVPTALYFRGMPSAAPEMRLDITTPPTSDPISLAISPDARTLVFVATSDGQPRLWLRPMESATAQPIAGTEGATYPFWSPDSRTVGFFADGKLKRIDVHGGVPQTLASAPGGRGGSWNKDGVIVFAPAGTDSLYRLSASGGESMPVTRTDARQSNHRMPQFLPDGRHFLFYAQGNAQGVYLGSLDSKDTRRLLDADTAAVFVPSGHICFLRQGTLFAERFDEQKNELIGDAFAVAQQIAFDSVLSIGALSAAPGVLGYRTGSALGRGRLTWFERSGKSLGTMVGEADMLGLNPELSPDGKRVALDRGANVKTDVWLLETARGVFTRFTSGAANNLAPIWSPDGTSIAFASNRNGLFDLYQKPASGVTEEKLLLQSAEIKWPEAWSPDGQFVLYREQNPKTNFDLWAFPISGAVKGDQKPFPIANSVFEEREGQFSPDGHWVAYQSNESGRFEIYIQSFPVASGKVRISTNGGAQARWRKDGKELFYIALDGRLTAVPLMLSSNGQTIDVGKASPLFTAHLTLGPLPAIQRHQYVASPDGQRFLMNITNEEQTGTPITLILNWHPEQKK
jgi:Tol biopolymer transport system component